MVSVYARSAKVEAPAVGFAETGDFVGREVGTAVEGLELGEAVGLALGFELGTLVLGELVGEVAQTKK